MKKILVICDDVWHPAEVIRKGCSYLTEFYEQMTFVEDAKDMLAVSDLSEYGLIICCKGNNLTGGNPAPWFEEGVTEVGPKEFLQFVENGGGFLSVHAANSFSEKGEEEKFDKPCREYIEFIGNRFITHPPRCMVNYEILDEIHPVTKGVKNFSVRDEHYQIEMVAENAKILMESTSADGQRMPACYVRELGKGKVCVIMPGHILEVWRNSEFQQLMKNAIDWCMQN